MSALAWMLAGPLYATHLVGGTGTYTYLGQVNGSYHKYRVKFLIYRDCTSQTPFDQPIYVGVYERTSAQTYTLKFRDSIYYSGPPQYIQPLNAASCPFQPNVCLQRAVYEKDFILPPSQYGYAIVYVRCCRNDPTNMMQDMGQTYVVEIPPTTTTNNSPVFQDLPVPYFCVDDTVSFDWSAVDTDGDSLVYQLAHPYSGGTPSQPVIVNYPPLYSWPPTTVNYQAGYSASAPFGPGGAISLDSVTGRLTAYVPSAGTYVVAMDVWEYRNGVLLSRTRRDIQLIALNCPPNPAPRLTSLTGTTAVMEGETLNLTLRFSDTDSIYLQSVVGEPFNANPAASYSAPSGGIGTFDVDISWHTACGQGRTAPYPYTVKVRDNGCPPKSTIYQGLLWVLPFQAAAALQVPQTPCHGEEVWVTAVNSPPGTQRQWQVTGAATILTDADSAVLIRFTNPSNTTQPATIRLIGTSPNGCKDTLTRTVSVGPAPPPYAWNPQITICDGESVRLGDSSTIRSGYQYQWHPTTGLDNPTDPLPLLTVQLDSPTVQYLNYVLEMTTDAGCTVWDTVTVRVNPLPAIDSLMGDSVYCVGGEFEYAVDSSPGVQYRWRVGGGTLVGDSTRASVRVLWQQPVGAWLEVEATNVYGCTRTRTFYFQSYVPRPDTVYGRRVVCPNAWIYYWVDTVPGSRYYWRVTGGLIKSDSIGDRILVKWGNPGSGTVSVVQQTREGCWGDTVTIPVAMSYNLQTPPIEGPDTLCLTDTLVPYQVPPANGSYFKWGVAGLGGFVVWGQGTHSVRVKWTQPGLQNLYVRERAYDSVNARWCYGDTVWKQVRLFPSPDPLSLLGDSMACDGDSDYVVVFKGAHTQSVAWQLQPTPHQYQADNDGLTVWWDSLAHYQIMAWPVSSDGCVGEGDTLEVDVYPTPGPVALDGTFDVCLPDSAQPYIVRDPLPSLTYFWQVEGGRMTDSTDTAVVVDWNQVPAGLLTVQAVSDRGCRSEPRRWTVRIDSPIITLRLVTTLENDDRILRIEWDTMAMFYHPDEAPLHRRSSAGTQITFDVPARALFYEDQTAHTAALYYDYQIAARNICGEKILSTPHRSILLQGEKADNFHVNLWFNRYRGWLPDGYEIWVRTNEQPAPVNLLTTSDTAANIDVLPYSGFKKCFRAAAVADSGRMRSLSNWWCAAFDAYLWVPTAFSPNGDGVNDTFAVVGGNFRTFTMMIYDRWGTRIFSTDDYRTGWDGTWKGKPAPEGVYLVLIKYQGGYEPRLHRSWLTLMR